MIIRKYRQEDAAAVRYICLNSEGENTDSAATNRYVLTTYCNYYIENEPENCFVAEADNGEVAGYVICTEDFGRFYPVFLKKYVPRALCISPVRAVMAVKSVKLQKKYGDEYPAHLHIDVLPQYQRQGLGGSLIDELCDSLNEKEVKGLMLTVGSDNATGISFYKKYGFTLLEQSGGDVAFGIKL